MSGVSRSMVVKGAVTVGLITALLWSIDLVHVAGRVAYLDAGWLAAGFVAVLAAVGVSALKCGLILARRGHPRPYPRLLRHYFIGLFFNNVLPCTGGKGRGLRWPDAGCRENLLLPPPAAWRFCCEPHGVWNGIGAGKTAQCQSTTK